MERVAWYPIPVLSFPSPRVVEDQDLWHLMGEAYIDDMVNSEKLPILDKSWNYSGNKTVQLDLIVFV
jgi:hypothetical protein